MCQQTIFLEMCIRDRYKVYLEGTQVKMAKVDFDEEVLEELTPETQLLSRVTKLKGSVIKLASFNQDELVLSLIHI